MWNRKVVVSGATFATVGLMVACSEAPPTEPPAAVPGAAQLFGGPPADPHSYTGTLDAHFVEIAHAVPGFAGFYRGEDGSLNVMMVPGTQAGSAAQVQQALAGHLATMGVNLAAQPVNIRAAQYDFIALDAVRAQVRQIMSVDGVVSLDTDEVANRVRFGVSSEAARGNVEHALGMLGVNGDMVVISHADPIEPMQSLQSRVRPTAGGLQLAWPRGPNWFACTLGFNVRSPEAPGVHGFVTNSHCSTNEYGTGPTGTPYYQHLPPALGGVNTLIGHEVHDLPTFVGGACPAGRQCRWSDAAGVQYGGGEISIPGEIAFARIYRTLPGTLNIDPANPMFEITAEQAFPFIGDPIHKVGRTTGWTQGTLTGSCVDTNVGGTSIPNLTLLCQEHVTGPPNSVGGGDSGSPTFHPFPVGQLSTVRLNGVLWGGNAPGTVFVFSAMNEVRFENTPPPGLSYITN